MGSSIPVKRIPLSSRNLQLGTSCVLVDASDMDFESDADQGVFPRWEHVHLEPHPMAQLPKTALVPVPVPDESCAT